MNKESLDVVVEKTRELINAPTCCSEAKAAAQAWLDAIGTEKESAEATLQETSPEAPLEIPSVSKRKQVNYEKFIGENLFGKIGILVFVIGVGFFVNMPLIKTGLTKHCVPYLVS